MEFEKIRIYSADVDDLGEAELPAAWDLFPGDMLLDRLGRPVRVTEVLRFPVGSPCSAAVKVERMFVLAYY